MTETELYRALWLRMLRCFSAEDPKQIAHTQSVVDYTEEIARRENLPPRRVFLLKIAALLHDIGCPAARKKYGDSLPPHQEMAGEAIVRAWLRDYPEFVSGEVEFLALAVGAHHRMRLMEKLHAEPLFEADLMVNLLEGYYPQEKAPEYGKKMIQTKSGEFLFRILFDSAAASELS